MEVEKRKMKEEKTLKESLVEFFLLIIGRGCLWKTSPNNKKPQKL